MKPLAAVIDTLRATGIVNVLDFDGFANLENADVYARSFDNETIPDKTTKLSPTNSQGRTNFDLAVRIAQQGTNLDATVNYMLRVERAGYEADSAAVSFSRGDQGIQTITLNKIITVMDTLYATGAFKTLDALTSAALANVAMTLPMTNVTGMQDSTYSFLSNAQGLANFNIIAAVQEGTSGTFTYTKNMTFSKSGYDPLTAPVTITNGANGNISFSLNEETQEIIRKWGSVDVDVEDAATGVNLTNAQVQLILSGNANVPDTIVYRLTNSLGKAEFDNAFKVYEGYENPSNPTVNYTIKTIKEGYTTKIQTATLGEGANPEVNARLDEIAAIIDTLRATGIFSILEFGSFSPLPNADIYARSYDNTTIPDKTTKFSPTNAAGEINFTLDVRTAEEGTLLDEKANYMLRVERNGYATDSVAVVFGAGPQGTQTITLKEITTALDTLYANGNFKIIDDQTSAALASVAMSMNMTGVPGMQDSTYTFLSNTQGLANFNIIAAVQEGTSGTFTYTKNMTLSKSGYENRTVPVTISNGANGELQFSLEEVTQELIKKWGSVTVDVENAATGANLANAQVKLLLSGDANVPDTTIIRYTNAQGKADFDAFKVYQGYDNPSSPTIVYTVKAILDGFDTKTKTETFGEGANTEVDMPLDETITASDYRWGEARFKFISDATNDPIVNYNVKFEITTSVIDTVLNLTTDAEGKTGSFVYRVGEGDGASVSASITGSGNSNFNGFSTTRTFSEENAGIIPYEANHKLVDMIATYLVKARDENNAAVASANVKSTIDGAVENDATDANGEQAFSVTLGENHPMGEPFSETVSATFEVTKTDYEGVSKTKTLSAGDNGSDIYTLESLVTVIDTLCGNGTFITKNLQTSVNLGNVVMQIQATSMETEVPTTVFSLETNGSGIKTYNFPVYIGPEGTGSGETAVYQVQLSRTGFEDKTVNMTIGVGDNGPEIISLTEEAGVPQHQDFRGKAIGENGSAMSGVTLKAVGSSGTFTTTSDGGGNYELEDMVAGTYTISIGKSGKYAYGDISYTVPATITVESDTAVNIFGAVLYDKISGVSATDIKNMVEHGTDQDPVKYWLSDAFNSTEKEWFRTNITQAQSDESYRSFTESSTELNGEGINIRPGTPNTNTVAKSISTPLGTLRPLKSAETTIGTGNYIVLIHELKQGYGLSIVGDQNSVMNANAGQYTTKDKQISEIDKKHSDALYHENTTYIPLTKIKE